MFRLGVLASGMLGYRCLTKIFDKVSVDFVYTDKASKLIIDYCLYKEVPFFLGNPRNRHSRDFISQFNEDVLLSINYLYIVDDFIYRHPRKIAINLHGSLLPKYRGRTPHVWAIINGETETGVTAHRISEGCDEGDILYQEVIEIASNSTGADILAKFEDRYPVIIDSVIDMIAQDKIVLRAQNNAHATYYGKRTPDDGLIDWNWQRQRIKNWVRAQCKPYPGAFTFLKDNRIYIHAVEFSDIGFLASEPNGKILCVDDGIVVKTPNGAIKLLDIETNVPINFEKGDIFYAGD